MTKLEEAIDQLKGVNVQLNDLEALLGMSDLHACPTHLEIDFSIQCNFRCVMCHQSKIEIAPSMLNSDQVDLLIDRLPVLQTVLIAGLGEPLLYKPLEKFLPYVSRYRCEAQMFTNGELIDRRLDLLSHLDRIYVSFDGANRETFERLRVGSNFDRILSNLEKLRHHCPDTCIGFSTVVSNVNVGQVYGIVEHASNLGIDEVHLSPVSHTPSLALRVENCPVFETQLEEATKLANSTGVRIVSNLNPDHFGQDFNSKVTETDESKASRGRSKKVVQSSEVTIKSPGESKKFIHQLSPDAELEELERRTYELAKHLTALEREVRGASTEIELPSCTVPWKYSFAKSTGSARLCPYADIEVGRIEEVLGGSYNSPILIDVRKSIAAGAPTFAVCRTCNDDHRSFRRASVEGAARLYLD